MTDISVNLSFLAAANGLGFGGGAIGNLYGQLSERGLLREDAPIPAAP